MIICNCIYQMFLFTLKGWRLLIFFPLSSSFLTWRVLNSVLHPGKKQNIDKANFDKLFFLFAIICNYFTVLSTNCLASYLFPNSHPPVLTFSNLNWNDWINAKVWCLSCEWKSIFLKEKIIFSNSVVAASTERLWQAGIPSSDYLGYINMYLLSILISFSFFYPVVLSSHNLLLLQAWPWQK